MILAGYETTANTLAYCIYFISKTPHCQQQLLDEIDQFKGCPSYGDLAAFPYVRAVVNEALRLYPPGPQLSRTAMEDVQVRMTWKKMIAPLSHARPPSSLSMHPQLRDVAHVYSKACDNLTLLATTQCLAHALGANTV